MNNNVSIVIPACNEEKGLETILPELVRRYPDVEILVVDDGSCDGTREICGRNGVDFISRPFQMGNGAAVKTGVRAARGDIIVLMDADGQHNPEDIGLLLAELEKGYDMAVGARTAGAHPNVFRLAANWFYCRLASWITSCKINDLTSGFRAVKKDKFLSFLHLLPNGFSYPTTTTMAFLRAGYAVIHVPVTVRSRVGTSHIRPLRDGVRFLLIIFKVGTLYSPLKFFAPISLMFFMTGLGYYLFIFFTQGRFTNMSALLFTTSILVFFIGIVSEQLTMLYYRDSE